MAYRPVSIRDFKKERKYVRKHRAYIVHSHLRIDELTDKIKEYQQDRINQLTKQGRYRIIKMRNRNKYDTQSVKHVAKHLRGTR